ncbi:MAG: FHA domain-containing protein [Bacteroidales bacterium]|nr:FHA domain-containing protein [Bacteroidales bacterium]MCD8394375.1 FHA domain-containing protein [Bacteroidales bacterium]
MTEYRIGTDYEGPVKIPATSTSVSHDHAIIQVDGDDWTLIDNNSTNGTFVEAGGQFHRCARIRITPDTWIRLGPPTLEGHFFKARRVLKPNLFNDDFQYLRECLERYQKVSKRLTSKMKWTKSFLAPIISLVVFVGSFLVIPQNSGASNNSMMLLRVMMILPGILTPMIQNILLNRDQALLKEYEQDLICPRCRKRLREEDITLGICPHCKAH